MLWVKENQQAMFELIRSLASTDNVTECQKAGDVSMATEIGQWLILRKVLVQINFVFLLTLIQ